MIKSEWCIAFGLVATMPYATISAQTHGNSEEHQMLVITELFNVVLYDIAPPLGVSLTPSGNVLAWGDGMLRHCNSVGDMIVVGAGQLAYPAAAGIHNGQIVVFDQAQMTAVHFAYPNMNYEESESVSFEGRLLAAHVGQCGLVLITQQATGNNLLVQRESRVWIIPLRLPGDQFYMSDVGRNIAITAQSEPPVVMVVDCESLKKLLEIEILNDDSSTNVNWHAHRMVATDREYLLTLSDVTSDLRTIWAIDADGQVLRKTLVNAPMSLVGAVQEDQLMIAVRFAEHPELVVYRWQYTQ